MVKISGLWTPAIAREVDTVLTDIFARQGMMDKQMRSVNICRICLQAFYTSDITDLEGNTIEEWAKQGERQANRMSKWNWAVQQRPPVASFKKMANGTTGHHIGRWGPIPAVVTIGNVE
jgi:hypothetical protein